MKSLKFWLIWIAIFWITFLFASAIAGIVMYNGRLRETSVQRIIEEDEPITHYSFKLVEHAKDKVLEIFNKCEHTISPSSAEHYVPPFLV